jgi:hypothetical protein
MAQGKLIILNNAIPEREDEYNDWYSNKHVADVVRIPGILTGRRFTRMEQQRGPDQPYKYSAMYDIEAEMAPQIVSELSRRAHTPEMPLSTAVTDPRYLSFFDAITPLITAKPGFQSRFTFLVLLNAADGRDDELNDWYTNTHLPDLLRVPGIVAGQRFRLAAAQRNDVQPWKYLCLYECDAEEPRSIIDAIAARIGTTEMPMNDSLADKRFSVFLRPITDLISSTPQ